MGREHEFRGLIATQPTLRLFIIIGIIIAILGIFLLWLNLQIIGIILTLFGILISAVSLLALMFLWLSNRILPHPK